MHAVIRTVIFYLLCSSISLINARAAQPTSLSQAEASLQKLFSKINIKGPDEPNLQYADSINNLLNQSLQIPGAFEYPFDSLKSAGKITSSNKKVRIFTWNLPLKDGTHQFYGFLLYKGAKTNNTKVFRLTDRSATIENSTLVTLTPENWYGCLVYDIIEKKSAGDTYYTLLGYAPVNLFVSRKLADILWFNEMDEPQFGKAVFHYSKQMQYRIVFEYAAKVQMSLKWNETMNMIVFDHLSPINSSYKGNYQYYGPDLSYDALRFEKGVWETLEDVDVRN